MQVSEVATATTGHQYFLANLVRSFENGNTPATVPRHARTQESGGAAAQNNDIVIIHGANIAGAIAAP